MKPLAIMVALIILSGVPLKAQDTPSTDQYMHTDGSAYAIWTSGKQYAGWTTKISADGHYIGTFDDPNNEWRCAVAASNGQIPSVVTIVCFNLNDVQESAHDKRKSAPETKKQEKQPK